MTSSRDNTRPCSFKKVPIFCDSIEVEEGPRRVTYVYLNSERRTQKYLGKLPPIFTFRGHTYGATGDEYERAKGRLINALNEKTPGVFVDPFGGNNNCTSGVFKYKQSFSESNRCNFTITFSVITGGSSFPQKKKVGNASSVAKIGLDVSRELQQAVGNAMLTTDVTLLKQGQGFFGGVGDFVTRPDILGNIGETLADTVAFAEKAIDIKEQADFYASNPLLGLAAITDSLLGVNGLTTDIFSLFEACRSMFDAVEPIGLEDNYVLSNANDTVLGNQGKSNVSGQENFLRGSALIEGYKQAATIKYDSADQVSEVRKEVESQFKKLSDSMGSRERYQYLFPTVVSPSYYNTMLKMRKMRVEVLSILDEQERSARRIETIEVERTPLSILAYTLYGDSSRSGELAILNGVIDDMDVSGKINIYSE